MKTLLSILEEQMIPLNMCYCNYELKEDEIIIKKSNDLYSSTIEVKEMLDLHNVFDYRSDVDFTVLGNGDISIRKIN